MNKQEFLGQLKKGLSGLPKDDIEDRLSFYSDMIDDRIEDGKTEEEAINEIGSMDDIVSQIIADIPLTKLVKEKIKPRKRLKAWEIVLILLGSPIWLSLLVAFFSVILALYLTFWTVIISLWVVFISLVACSLAGVIAGAVFSITGMLPTGPFLIGAGLICAGLSIFMFFGCMASSKGILNLTRKFALAVKNSFINKEEK